MRAGDQTAPAIDVEVVAGSIRPRARRRGGRPVRRTPSADPFGDPFEEMIGRPRGRSDAGRGCSIEAQPSRTRLYVGEPLVLTYCALHPGVGQRPAAEGRAAVRRLLGRGPRARPDARPSGEPATLGGESYRRFPFLKKLLFPTKAGPLTLPPGDVPDRPRPPGLLRRRRVRRARDEARDDHRLPAARGARLLRRGRPLQRDRERRPRRRRRSARR